MKRACFPELLEVDSVAGIIDREVMNVRDYWVAFEQWPAEDDGAIFLLAVISARVKVDMTEAAFRF